MSALVASLFAVGASPAAAIDDDSAQDHEATATACLGPALADRGFTDLGTLDAAVTNINCLAYYGISAGKTADTFDPDSNVTRGQMALFLVAAARLMGADLTGGDMTADFGDIADLGENRQNAITSLARNGIMSGRGDMAFEPHADITRAEMAVALVALLDHTPGAPVHKDKDTGLYELGDTADAAKLPDDYFLDARQSTPRHVDNAISAAYELGITSGTGDGMFSPQAPVPRRNMARFITNALAHSNARPAGVTAQLAGTKITVSVRDAMFAPVVNADVDVFKAAAAQESRAFKDDGTCTSRATAFTGEGTDKCEIDGSDPVTGTDGNVELADIKDQIGEGLTVWVWTGKIGDKFGSDTKRFKFSVPKTAAPVLTAVRASHSTDLPKQTDGETAVERARFGRTVTVTIQLKGDTNADGDSGAIAPADLVNTGRRADDDTGKYSVSIETFSGTTTLNDTTRMAQSSTTVTVNSAGAATFTVTATDTDPNNPGQTQTVRYTITPAAGSQGFGDGTANQGSIVFTDAIARPTYMSVSVDGSRVAPGTGATASNRATVTVLDQYGNPFRGAPIRLFSNNPLGSGDTEGSDIRESELRTGSRGTVTIGFPYTGGASQQQLVAMWDGYVAARDLNGDGDTDDEGEAPAQGTAGFASVTAGATFTVPDDCQDNGSAGADLCAATLAHWVTALTDASTAANLEVLSLDAENDQIIYDNDPGTPVVPMSVNYDSNDAFEVTSPDGDDADSDDDANPVSLVAFEEALAKALKDSADITTRFPTLTVTSYVHDDSTDIASFEIDVTIDQ